MAKNFLTILDLNINEIKEIFSLTWELKNKKNKDFKPLDGKTLGMIFQKPSTRTRVSFEVGMYQLGGYSLFLNSQDLQLKRGETLKDTAITLSNYLNAVVLRVFDHQDLVEFSKYSKIPVINGLSNLYHPLQVLSDVYTIAEEFFPKSVSGEVLEKLKKIKILYIGDGNNVCNSWINMSARLGLKLNICTPKGYEPNKKILENIDTEAKKTQAEISLYHFPSEAAQDADVIYTDVWTSMGDESSKEQREKDFLPYQVNTQLLSFANPQVRVMHCLPARRGLEITDEVMDGPNSIIIKQAQNRLHLQKALLLFLLR